MYGKEFVKNLIFKFSGNYFLQNLLLEMPVSHECSLSMLRFVDESSHDLNNKTHRTKIKRTSLRLHKYLKTLTHLEEAELNLFGAPNKQKKSIIKNLNKNLKSLKLTFLNPISFLLYIGKTFKQLQTLHVGFFGKEFNVDQSKYFSKLNEMNITVFRNLKRFKFFCDDMCKPCPLILNTILTILNGCHKTLTHFELEFYNFADVNEIVDIICSKNMPLRCISFKFLRVLSDASVMKLARLNNNNELQIQMKECGGRLTRNGIKAALTYIEQNRLNKEIVWNERIINLSTF